MLERQPSPDLLLKQVMKQEERTREGKLTIFFGAAPGVGKTYSMLEAAQQRRTEGIDVAAGIVETHGRKETEELLLGLETIQRHAMEYRNITLSEFDIDAALLRKPAIILIDDLAHTNVPGSRHKKRWQDVYELLEAGINVHTTLNVQHLESLSDIVTQITGITVHETLPDLVLDRADEIELIDLPPDELLQRLKEGKVYVGELAERARESFFRVGNLLALRELALRRTAEWVDEQMQTYRRDKGVTAVWPAAERILVCVGPNPLSIRLIRAAKRMAGSLRADWIAVSVAAPSKVRPSQSDLRRLSDHMSMAESLGAETVVLTGQRASEEILDYARSRNVTKIIIGKPTHPRWKDRLFGSLLDEMVRGSADIDVYVISGDHVEPAPVASGKRQSTAVWQPGEWFLSVASVAASTGLAALMFPYFTLVDLAMVYLLGIVFTASQTGKGPSFMASLLSVACFDFFFVPPYYTFAVSDVRFFITFGVMFIVAFVISGLTHRIREQVITARMRERRTLALYNLSRDLVHAQGIGKICGTVMRHISDVFSSQVVVLVPEDHRGLTIPATGPSTFDLDQKDMSVAQWTFDHRQRAGHGTDTLSGSRALYLPLFAASKTVGVIGILPSAAGHLFDQEQTHILESFANQTAMAIERASLAEEAQQALLKAETEALRNTLLSSVSHDLRTPLAAITGAASTLLQNDVAFEAAERQELLQTINEEAERLNQIVRNVLDMTRIEAGAIKVKKEWQPLEEIIGTVLNRLSDRIKDRPLKTRLPEDLPLISFDPLLLEQVFMNLLENALKYTPQETPIELSASAGGDEVMVELDDRGPGIPPGEEERIFEKFVRVSAAGGGIGLGLTICRAVVTAHGGRIWAKNRMGGGAAFCFTLPVGKQPPLPEPEE